MVMFAISLANAYGRESKIIFLDLETTGIDGMMNGIASIGAVMQPEEAEFYAEPRVDENVEIHPKAMEVNGFTEKDLYDPSKDDLSVVLEQFEEWSMQAKDRILAGWNTSFDVERFLRRNYQLCELEWTFGYRSIDVHSIAHFLMTTIDEFTPAHDGVSTVGLNYTLKWAGLPPEPDPHNALTGAQMNQAIYDHCVGVMTSEGGPTIMDKPDCPDCGERMTFKKPPPYKRWNAFWGCSTYPKCEGTRHYDE